jgi:hypothetical protein
MRTTYADHMRTTCGPRKADEIDPDLTKQKTAIGVAPGATPLGFLRAVYSNNDLPISMRMRAAIEPAPYVHPKLSATAFIAESDFAERLETGD